MKNKLHAVLHRKHTPAKMRLKLFVSFIAFVLIAIALLWGFQILLLDAFYYNLTKNRMSSAADEITDLYASNVENLSAEVRRISLNNEFCISLFGSDGKILLSADMGGCIVHNVNDDALNRLYTSALEAGGEYFKRAELSGFQTDLRSRYADFRSGEYKVRDRLLYVSVRETERGPLVLILDSAVTPVTMIKGALTLQLMMVSFVMTAVAGIMANFIAKRLSQPIADVNRAAKKLTGGEYDVEFTGGGYREIYELSDTLNRTAQDLKSTDRMQKELIANISHDLRTPLTLITGYCEMMRDIDGENTPENMQVVLDETARLSSLVNDLIDLSKIQSGVQKPEITRVDADYLLIETVDRYRKLMAGKGYTFVYDPIGPTFVQCDRKRIQQVVYNLVGNAVNYAGEDKTVVLRLSVTEKNRVRVEITDHGEGIAKEDLPSIFDRYYRVDKVHKRAVTGTGLGLSIVKNILQSHNAAFGVESTEGKGSTFWFEL